MTPTGTVVAFPERPRKEVSGEVPATVDAALAVTAAAVVTGASLVRRSAEVAAPVVALVMRPPYVPAPWQPAGLLGSLARRGRARRSALVASGGRVLDAWVPVLAAEVIRRLDLTRIVLDHVRLDAVVEAVDLDAAVARVDIDAAVARVDIDAIVERVDLDSAVARVDLDAAVARVDIDAIVERVDLDSAVARVNLDGAVALVDIDAIAARLDLDKVIDRIDLVTLVEEVIAAIDLPEIIRESSGSMASGAMRGVRMQGISADDAISRVLTRRGRRRQLEEKAPPT